MRHSRDEARQSRGRWSDASLSLQPATLPRVPVTLAAMSEGEVAISVQPLPPTFTGPADPDTRKCRYGVAYLRGLCAQAGYGMTENSPDEDLLAVDCTVEAPAVGIRVQVKCTSKAFSTFKQDLAWNVRPHWRERWQLNIHPVYFVAVRVPEPSLKAWIEHEPESTLHNSVAYWTRIDPQNIPRRVSVPKARQLTAQDLVDWEGAIMSKFGEAAS